MSEDSVDIDLGKLPDNLNQDRFVKWYIINMAMALGMPQDLIDNNRVGASAFYDA